MSFEQLKKAVDALPDTLAEALVRNAPQSILFCQACHRKETITPTIIADYFRNGWPHCCGQTLGFSTNPLEGDQQAQVAPPLPRLVDRSDVRDFMECEACGKRIAVSPRVEGWIGGGRSFRRLKREGKSGTVMANWCPAHHHVRLENPGERTITNCRDKLLAVERKASEVPHE